MHQLYSDSAGNGGYVQGTWRVVGDTFCTTWPTIAPGERCVTIYKLPDGTFESWSGGKRFTSFQVKPPRSQA